MPTLDYNNYAFSFLTVLGNVLDNYCCCSCGFEHEFMMYYTGNGQIDEAMYQKVANNIRYGKCKHVDEVSQQYVKNTEIFAVHIAVVVGTEKVLHCYFRDLENEHKLSHIAMRHERSFCRWLKASCAITCSTLFLLKPYNLALIKNGNLSTGRFSKIIAKLEGNDLGQRKFIFAYRPQSYSHMINIEYISLHALCVRKNYRHLLKRVCRSNSQYAGVSKMLEVGFKHNVEGLQHVILTYIRWHGKITGLINILLSAAEHEELCQTKPHQYTYSVLKGQLEVLLKKFEKECKTKIVTAIKANPKCLTMLNQVLNRCKSDFLMIFKENPLILDTFQLPGNR